MKKDLQRPDLYKRGNFPTPYEQKIKWLKDHGYEQEKDGLKITITLKGKNGTTASFEKMITWNEIENKTYDDLEEYDVRVWLKARNELMSFWRAMRDA